MNYSRYGYFCGECDDVATHSTADHFRVLSGHVWCEECACLTNHTVAEHRYLTEVGLAFDEEPEAKDDRFDVRHDAYKDGPDL